MKHRAESDSSQSIEDYFALPKTIGDVPGDVLMTIAHEHAQKAEFAGRDGTRGLRISLNHYTIASSALIEAMLIGQDDEHNHDDDRLDHINVADQLLQRAIDTKQALITVGLEPAAAEIDLQRLQLDGAFMQPYRDMVCGELTQLTCEQVCDALRHHLRLLDKQLSYRYNDIMTKTQATGLKGEVIALLDYWQRYEQAPDLIAAPSTRRGGDGNYRSSETHDIILFQETRPGSFEYHEAKEVKTGRAIHHKMRHLGRYANAILSVNPKSQQITEPSKNNSTTRG